MHRHDLESEPRFLTTGFVKQIKLQPSVRVDAEMADVLRAFNNNGLPTRPTESTGAIASQWPPQRGTLFEGATYAQFSIPIGCDVHESLWVLDQKHGKRKEPYANSTAFGWTLCGTLTAGTPKTSASFLNLIGKDMVVAVRRLYKYKFSDISE
ncbi:hypothetical protein FGIG_10441 [Fasciola gigantica]|uniref:Uncharacterized protein n=1 Tax=Fasciola gigantica TaxID=46835 RepID=A0A504YI86_FASGI|nr:hypothetical protein FGIG_10441 [Fasciola gigantica]